MQLNSVESDIVFDVSSSSLWQWSLEGRLDVCRILMTMSAENNQLDRSDAETETTADHNAYRA